MKTRNRGAKRRKEAIPKSGTNICKGPGFGHSGPNARKKEIMVVRRVEMAERRGRERRSDIITEEFRSRTKLRLENKEKNFITLCPHQKHKTSITPPFNYTTHYPMAHQY